MKLCLMKKRRADLLASFLFGPNGTKLGIYLRFTAGYNFFSNFFFAISKIVRSFALELGRR